MTTNSFKTEAMTEQNIKYKNAIHRERDLYKRKGDVRTDFARDYLRIIHCFGFRRLRHKTQVFFHPSNDHVCSRIEHAMHVASISTTICKKLELNVELANAIAIGHDIGHAPFGHHGEYVLDDLWRQYIEHIPKKVEGDKCQYFWHEKNSLFMVDWIETVKDNEGYQQNLNLTYAVRDGIICHCGEKEVKHLKPRGITENFPLDKITAPGKTSPYSWEGCVVRIADIISYLGRDIEDAEMANILTDKKLEKLKTEINEKTTLKIEDVSNNVIIHELIVDLLNNSNLKDGLSFSKDGISLLNQVKNYNYIRIYDNRKIRRYQKYITLMLNNIFSELNRFYNPNIVKSLKKLKKENGSVYHNFMEWLERYHNPFNGEYQKYESGIKLREKLYHYYNFKRKEDYMKAIIHFMSGFTDDYTIRCFNEVQHIL
jgi:dGTPase